MAECEAERLSEVVLRKHQRRCLQEIFGAPGGWSRSPCLRGGEEVENLVSVGGFYLGGGLMVGSVVVLSVISEV